MACPLERIANSDTFCDYKEKTNAIMDAVEPLCDIPTVEFGEYTPTFTSATAVDNFSAPKAYYHRIGNIVTVNGKVSMNYSTINTDIAFLVSLPTGLESVFTDLLDCNGIYNTNYSTDGLNNMGGVCQAQVGGGVGIENTAKFFGGQSATTRTALFVCFQFTYKIN